MNATEVAAVEAMAEKIARLQTQVTTLEKQLSDANKVSLNTMLPLLRAREIVLLYVGSDDTRVLVEQLNGAFGPREANHAIRHLWVLNHAQCSDEQREEFRALFDHGMSKF